MGLDLTYDADGATFTHRFSHADWAAQTVPGLRRPKRALPFGMARTILPAARLFLPPLSAAPHYHPPTGPATVNESRIDNPLARGSVRIDPRW